MQSDVEAAKVSGPTAPAYVNPTGDEYPVIAWDGYYFPDKSATSEEDIEDLLKTIKNCGFNATNWISEGLNKFWWNHISTYYKVAASLGLRTIYMLQNVVPEVKHKVSDSSQAGDTTYDPSLEAIAEILNLNKGDANLWGYKLADEPKYNMWAYGTPTAAVGTKDLLALYRTYLQNANGHVGYITLAVTIEEDTTGQKLPKNYKSEQEPDYMYRYRSYLESIYDKFKPSLLSVDLYPVLSVGETQHPIVKKVYYGYMEIIATFSALYNVPFWMYILSTQLTIYKKGSSTVETQYPLPTEGVLLFQAMTALAYGFQGLVFWTYTLHTNNMQTDSTTGKEIFKEKFELAPYNSTGRLDDEPVDGSPLSCIWNFCAVVIPVIKAFGKILLGAKFIEAGHVYGPEYIHNQFPETSQFSTPIGCVSKATAAEHGIVITRLDKGSEKYVAIVNHSPYNSEDFTLTISPRCKWTEYRMMDISDGYLTITEHERESQETTVSRYLQPGCMMLIKYEQY